MKIELVPNKGYDVAPFVSIINQVNLDNYSLIVKLHTKRDMPQGASFNYWDMSGKKWREYALSMLKTPIVFAQSVLSFQQNERLGMVANYHLIANKEQDDFVAQKKALNLLKQLDLPSEHYSFVAGTMFVCRANLFKPLQKLNLNLEDFAEPEKNHSSSLAHVIERLLGCLVVAQGYSIKDVFSKKQYNGTISRFFRVLRNFIYQKKENKKGLLKIKLFRIPVFVSQMHKTKERGG